MQELKKKVGKEIDKIIHKRNSIGNQNRDNAQKKENFIDQLHEEMKQLRDRHKDV